jgi:hypothetical protein
MIVHTLALAPIDRQGNPCTALRDEVSSRGGAADRADPISASSPLLIPGISTG